MKANGRQIRDIAILLTVLALGLLVGFCAGLVEATHHIYSTSLSTTVTDFIYGDRDGYRFPPINKPPRSATTNHTEKGKI